MVKVLRKHGKESNPIRYKGVLNNREKGTVIKVLVVTLRQTKENITPSMNNEMRT